MCKLSKARCKINSSGTFRSDLKAAILKNDSGFKESILSYTTDDPVYREATLRLREAIIDVIVTGVNPAKIKKKDYARLVVYATIKYQRALVAAL